MIATGSCGTAERIEEPGVPLWTLPDAPLVEIGVVGGAEEYQLHRVADVLRLAGGDLLIADDGTLHLSRFSPTGEFRASSGGKGEGPGEFTSLSGLHRGPADSVLTLDGWARRISMLDPHGGFARIEREAPYSGDSLFTMDQWLYGGFWVSGALEPQQRQEVKNVLDRLPQPGGPIGFRRVLVSDDGHVWVREPESGHTSPTYTVVDSSAKAVAIVSIPERFEPLDVSLSEVVGRWRDANDVEYVRVYALQRSSERGELPSWLTDPVREPAVVKQRPADPLSAVRPAVRALAIAQEMHYSTEFTYTSDLESLEWERPEGIEAFVRQADDRGWIGIFWHADWDFVCGIGYGFTAPAGWPQGTPTCGPPAGG